MVSAVVRPRATPSFICASSVVAGKPRRACSGTSLELCGNPGETVSVLSHESSESIAHREVVSGRAGRPDPYDASASVLGRAAPEFCVHDHFIA